MNWVAVSGKHTGPYTMTGQKCVGPVKYGKFQDMPRTYYFFVPVTVDLVSPSLVLSDLFLLPFMDSL